MTEKVTELLKKKNLDAILISDGYNMRYLSGFGGATGYLYISADQKVLMTDSRYTTQAKQEAPKFAVVEVSTEKGYRELITECIRKDQAKTIGFEDQQMICADFKKISSPTKDEATWMELGEEVNLLRCIKTEEELEKVAKAEAIGDQAFQKILGDIKPGVTELTIAAKLDYYMRELGAEGNSFDTIVASGLHSAMPHAVPTAKKLEKGDFITMDFGCRYDGYCSDMTRTVVLGEASSKQKEIYGDRSESPDGRHWSRSVPERRDRKSIRWQEGSLQKQVMASISDMDLGTASDFLSMKNRDCHQNATVYCRKI